MLSASCSTRCSPAGRCSRRAHSTIGFVSASTPPMDASLREHDPAIASIVRACLMRDPAVRPVSARAITRLLPGGDPLTAAVAEGRLLSPDMVASAGEGGELRPAYAWALCGAVVLGVLLVAARIGEITQLRPAGLPKPPDALIERAREILKVAGHDGSWRDSEHWFIAELESAASTQAANARLRRVRFAFRQSPSYLLPQNLFRIVTADDPAPTLPGMASLNLDADGRLIDLTIVPVITSGTATTPPDWNALFAAAGLSSSRVPRGCPGDSSCGPTRPAACLDRTEQWVGAYACERSDSPGAGCLLRHRLRR